MFGNNSNKTATNSFGATPATSNFGNSMNFGAKQNTSTNLFGQQQQQKSLSFGQQQQQQQKSLGFGQQQTQQSTSFGMANTNNSLFGQQQQPKLQQQQPVQQRLPIQQMKFKDLPQNYQMKLLNIEKYMRNQSQLRDEVNEIMEHHVNRDEDRQIEQLKQRLGTLSSSINKDQESLKKIYSQVSEDIKQVERASRAAMPQKNYGVGVIHENIYLPSKFHWKQLDIFEKRAKEKQKQIDNIEEYLQSRDSQALDSNVLQNILSHQHASLYAVAGKVSTAHSKSNKARAAIKDYLRSLQGRDKYGYDDDIDLLFKEKPKQPQSFRRYTAASINNQQILPQKQQVMQQQQQQQTLGFTGFGAKPATTTGGFGQTNTTGGGLFGAKPATTTGGFGQTNTAGSNLFGAKPATTTGGFGQTNTTGGGLFGAKPATTTGGFGQTNTTGGGLFGAKPATTTGGFGQTNMVVTVLNQLQLLVALAKQIQLVVAYSVPNQLQLLVALVKLIQLVVAYSVLNQQLVVLVSNR